MSGGFNDPIIGGGGALVYPSIHSPNFVTGLSGWTINKDGSAEFSNITARGSVIIKGTKGEFTYDAAGNLRSANCGQVTTDPVQGITCQQGFSTFNGHGAVINLLSTSNGAFFQYQDLGTSSQGLLILVVASTSGTDPVTSVAYQAGMTGVDPVFGDSVVTVGANISLVQVAYTRNAMIAANSGGGANQPKLRLDAPEQTQASHLQMWMTGESPDASKQAQFIVGAVSGAGVLTPQTSVLLEVQGTIAANLVTAIIGGAAETWHNLALVNGWTGTARYRLLPDGRVELDLALSAAAATAFQFSTMPAGYRPTASRFIAAAADANVGAAVTPRVQIASTGVISMFGLSAFSTASTWVAGGSYPLN